MKKKLSVSFFMLCCICVNLGATTQSYIEDYCWRDYNGVIPDDAMAHGLDSKEKPVYIGQALYEKMIIPGQIYSGDKNIYFEWKNKVTATYKNIKILCSKNANRFQWVPTTSSGVVLLTNKILISGGYEPGYSTYIGRKEENGVTYVGKVICSTDTCFGLYTTHDGKASLDSTFEILAYNP